MKNSRQKSFLILLFIGLFSILQIYSQNSNSFQNILGNLATYASSEAPEKVYVQTDKDFYTNGETIWLKTYILNGISHLPSTKSRVVYVELIDSKGNIVAQRKLYTASIGAPGDIALPKDIKADTYILRAYTKYMLNDQEPVCFQKEIPIWAQRATFNEIAEKTSRKNKEENTTEKITALGSIQPIVQFFPEGGDLVSDIESVLGIKITDEKGNGLALEGKIFNQNGALVSVFKSYEFGLGRTSFKVLPDMNYYLQIQIDGNFTNYPIPAPLSKGYALRVLNMGKYLKIRVATNSADGLEGAVLLGHLRGDLIFKQNLKKNAENSYTIKLLTSKLRDGIAHFTLFAPNGEPVSERLTFIESVEDDLKLSVKTDKINYGFRSKVNLDLALVDDSGKPLNGDFSMSVVTESALQKVPIDIKGWLLLNSDLGRTIPNPNFFFQEDVKGRRFLLDLLMLTHGWRRFTWQSFMNGRVRKELAFPPEKGIMINGYTTAFNNRYQPKKTLTTLNVLAKEISQDKKTTNAQGKFSFGPFLFQDSISTIINAESLAEGKKKKNPFAIYLDPPFPSINANNPPTRKIKTTTIVNAQPYLQEAQRKRIADFKFDPKITRLKEVVVKSEKKTRQELIDEELNARTLYGEARNRLFPDSIPWMQNALSVMEIVRLVPGVQVFGTFPNQTVRIRGSQGSPLYLLDGVPVSTGLIQTMPSFDILFVDVLKGADAAIYGLRAGNGVVALYTKRGGDFQQPPERVPGSPILRYPDFIRPGSSMPRTTH